MLEHYWILPTNADNLDFLNSLISSFLRENVNLPKKNWQFYFYFFVWEWPEWVLLFLTKMETYFLMPLTLSMLICNKKIAWRVTIKENSQKYFVTFFGRLIFSCYNGNIKDFRIKRLWCFALFINVLEFQHLHKDRLLSKDHRLLYKNQRLVWSITLE